jgi:hypothetical protein
VTGYEFDEQGSVPDTGGDIPLIQNSSGIHTISLPGILFLRDKPR